MKIAWISRHAPLPAQLRELRRIFGNIEIIRISRTFTSVETIYRLLLENNIKYAVVVLPLTMISHLLELCKKSNITLIFARMTLLHDKGCLGAHCELYDPDRDVLLKTKNDVKIRHLRFLDFKRIKEVKLVFEDLDPVSEQ